MTIPAPPESGATYEIVVLPYLADSDELGSVRLPVFWQRLHEEGIFELFFHDHPDMSFSRFVRSLTQPDDLIFMIGKSWSDGRIEHMGMATLSQILDNSLTKRAVAGFLFFKAYWNHRDADEAGRKVISMWFNELKLKTIAGLTPKVNRPALAYIHRLGFVSIGEMPDFCLFKGRSVPATVSYLTPALFSEKQCQQP